MKFNLQKAGCAIIGCLSFIAVEASAGGQDNYVPGEVIVKFKSESGVVMKANAKGGFATSSKKSLDTRLNDLGIKATEKLMPLTGELPKDRKAPQRRLPGGRVIKKADLSKLYCLRFDNGHSVEEMIEQLSAMPEVEYAEPNRIVSTCAFETNYSSDPLYSQQWAINAVNLPQLWAMPATDSRRPVVAIIDTGVDITHPDLADNIWTNELEANGAELADDDNNGYYDDVHGWDFVKGTAIINNGNDLNGHGTHCAGIAAACGNNGLGIVGANPDALIMAVRVLDERGKGDVATYIRGVDYAVAAGADVLSMSFGSYGLPGRAETEALQNASFGAVCVAAAGNDTYSIYDELPDVGPAISSPGGFECVVGVMSSGRDDSRSGFSNYDPDGAFFSKYQGFYNYDITAPGEGIISTFPGGGYKELSGTSMSTPLVAGAISRMLQVGGYDKVKEYGFIGDIAMSRKEGTEVFDAAKTLSFNESNRETTIVYSAIEIDDREFGDGDGELDAGETVDIYPTLRSVWGQVANDIILSASLSDNMSDNACEFINNDVEFGYHLNSRGSAKSKNPIRIKIPDNINDGYNLSLIIKVKTTDKDIYSQEVSYPVCNKVELGGIVDDTLILSPDKSYVLDRNLVVSKNGKLIVRPGTTITIKNDDRHQQKISSEEYIPDKILFLGTPDSMIVIKPAGNLATRNDFDRFQSATCKYVRFENLILSIMYSDLDNCILDNCTITEADGTRIDNSAIINSTLSERIASRNINFANGQSSSDAESSNLISVIRTRIGGSGVIRTDKPNYWGSIIESTVRKNIFDIEHPTEPIGNAKIDLSNMLKQPSPFTHGLIWKVCVNGHDAQDELDDILPLGIGRHKFEIYFNRKINRDFTPAVSMGLQAPYNKIKVEDNGEWRSIALDGYDNRVKWSFEGEASLDSDGFFTCENDATIMAIRGKYSEKYSVKCIPNSYDINNPISLHFSGNREMKYPLLPMVWCDTPSSEVSWSTSDKSLATVDADGYLTLHNYFDNYVEITATHNGQERKCNIKYSTTDNIGVVPALHISEAYLNPARTGAKYKFTSLLPDDLDEALDVYTAYVTISGKEDIDGLNRISVSGARDNDNFEIPTENTRFNVMIQAAGSMSSGFMAETGVGRVKLTWENPEDNFDDMLGYNMYRYTTRRDEETGKTVSNDTIKINERLLDTEEYVDYDIVPGTTYYYFYKVMRTNFTENSPSKVVAATPRAAGKGDANASGDIDVADVVTEVNYMVGRDPKPFIFEAADVNGDEEIDILDVVGTVNIIMAPAGNNDMASATSVATYTVENGILYVDCPVELAGVQAELNGSRGKTEIAVLPALRGMESTGDWISDAAYRFIAFSLSGKTLGYGRHALLSIGDASLSDLILVDQSGNRIMAIDSESSGISPAVMQQMKTPTPNPFVDIINVPVVIGTEGNHDVELSLHSLSGAKVLSHNVTLGYGEHNVVIDGSALGKGFYMLTLTVDGTAVQTHKVIKK